jgi:hypothetical protein
LACCCLALQLTGVAAQEPLLLWPDGAPGALGSADTDKPPFHNAHPWANDCAFWLQGRGFVKPRSP